MLSDNAGRTLLELAMSWLVNRPGVDSIISGATTPNQVKANATAASWVLEDTELEMIEEITALS